MRIVNMVSLLCAFVMLSCKESELKKRLFTAFEFYHDNTWTTAFSVRFSQSDTTFIRQHFASLRYSATDTSIRTNTSYIGKLSEQENNTLNSLIRNINFSRYDTSYNDEGLEDGSTFLFYIQQDSLSKIIHIYGDSAPPELLQLGRWIADLKSSLKLIEVDSLITFEHANDRLPLPVNVKNATSPGEDRSSVESRLDGVYAGLEEMCWISDGKKECFSDPFHPNYKWYHLTYISIKGDSASAGQSPIAIYKRDTGWSASDGGFYSYRGTITRQGSKGEIKLNLTKCDYCGLEAARENLNAFPDFPWTKNYSYKVVAKGLYINGYLFKKMTNKPW